MRQQKISVYVKPLKDKNLMSHKQKRYMQAQDSLQAGYAKCFLLLQRCLHLPKLDLNIQTSKKLVGPVKVKHQRKGSASPEGHREPQEDLRLAHEEIFSWGKRMCKRAEDAGCSCSYKQINVFTEFTGSTCAESAVESIVNFMDKKSRPDVKFMSMADIKHSCREVAMATRS